MSDTNKGGESNSKNIRDVRQAGSKCWVYMPTSNCEGK